MNQSKQNPILDDKIDYNKIDTITDTLMDLPYEQILAKSDNDIFFNIAFKNGPLDQITVLRDMMVEDFLPEKKPGLISVAKRDKVIEVLAGIKSDTENTNIEKWLKDIDPVLLVPKNFDKVDYQQRAYKIWNGMQNLKTVIAEESVNNYVNDVNYFLKMTDEQLGRYQNEIGDISNKIQAEYQSLIEKGNFNKEIMLEAIDYIGRCGRTPTYVSSLEENHNLGVITEIILKINRAILIAQQFHSEKLTEQSSEVISDKIKDYFIKEIHL